MKLLWSCSWCGALWLGPVSLHNDHAPPCDLNMYNVCFSILDAQKSPDRPDSPGDYKISHLLQWKGSQSKFGFILTMTNVNGIWKKFRGKQAKCAQVNKRILFAGSLCISHALCEFVWNFCVPWSGETVHHMFVQQDDKQDDNVFCPVAGTAPSPPASVNKDAQTDDLWSFEDRISKYPWCIVRNACCLSIFHSARSLIFLPALIVIQCQKEKFRPDMGCPVGYKTHVYVVLISHLSSFSFSGAHTDFSSLSFPRAHTHAHTHIIPSSPSVDILSLFICLSVMPLSPFVVSIPSLSPCVSHSSFCRTSYPPPRPTAISSHWAWLLKWKRSIAKMHYRHHVVGERNIAQNKDGDANWQQGSSKSFSALSHTNGNVSIPSHQFVEYKGPNTWALINEDLISKVLGKRWYVNCATIQFEHCIDKWASTNIVANFGVFVLFGPPAPETHFSWAHVQITDCLEFTRSAVRGKTILNVPPKHVRLNLHAAKISTHERIKQLSGLCPSIELWWLFVMTWVSMYNPSIEHWNSLHSTPIAGSHFHIGAVNVKKVDVNVKISLSMSLPLPQWALLCWRDETVPAMLLIHPETKVAQIKSLVKWAPAFRNAGARPSSPWSWVWFSFPVVKHHLSAAQMLCVPGVVAGLWSCRRLPSTSVCQANLEWANKLLEHWFCLCTCWSCHI